MTSRELFEERLEIISIVDNLFQEIACEFDYTRAKEFGLYGASITHKGYILYILPRKNYALYRGRLITVDTHSLYELSKRLKRDSFLVK